MVEAGPEDETQPLTSPLQPMSDEQEIARVEVETTAPKSGSLHDEVVITTLIRGPDAFAIHCDDVQLIFTRGIVAVLPPSEPEVGNNPTSEHACSANNAITHIFFIAKPPPEINS